MSSGEVLKADKDFTKEVDAAIPEAEKLASVCWMASEAGNRLT
jgi:26S proteasome regulatory subunit N5